MKYEIIEKIEYYEHDIFLATIAIEGEMYNYVIEWLDDDTVDKRYIIWYEAVPISREDLPICRQMFVEKNLFQNKHEIRILEMIDDDVYWSEKSLSDF